MIARECPPRRSSSPSPPTTPSSSSRRSATNTTSAPVRGEVAAPYDEDNSQGHRGRRKKPSYVGVATSAVGYGSYTRYTSPVGKRDPPKAIPVKSEPQVLDSVDFLIRRNRGLIHNGEMPLAADSAGLLRESSPFNGSDDSGASSSSSLSPNSVGGNGFDSNMTKTSGGGSNLVQKQIARLYGSNIQQSVSNRSTITKNTCSTTTTTKNIGYFTNKLNGETVSERQEGKSDIVRNTNTNGNTNNAGGPLEFQPLKAPAVFRLLRPEFRELLKSNSCQIPSDHTTPPKLKSPERVIPIHIKKEEVKEIPPQQQSPKPKERIIPIQVTGKASDEGVVPLEVSEMKTTAATEEGQKNRQENNGSTPLRVEENEDSVVIIEEQNEDEEEEVEDQLSNVPDYQHDQYESIGGVKEVAFLGTIMEEDNESTASGSQVNLSNSSNSLKRSPNAKAGGAPGAKSTQIVGEKSEEPKSSQCDPSSSPKKDGHYFIKLLENETFRFEELICDFEEDLEDKTIEEDIRDSILAAIGKAKLLMAQKLAQFRGLCVKNVTLSVEEDPFVPTSQDLAGFWDMVYIQIEHINMLFADLAETKKNGWKHPEGKSNSLISPSMACVETDGKSPKKSTPTSNIRKPKAKRTSTSPNSTTPKAGGVKSEAAKARDEARKKMLEERKKQMLLMKQKQKEESGSNGDENFIQF